MQLVCLPFAGGNETSYERLRPYLPEGWELVNFTFPGKGSRMAEPALTDLHAMVSEVLLQWPEKGTEPYVLYGHSMGAMLAHMLLQRLHAQGSVLPTLLVVSSFPAPSHHHDRHRRQMNDTQFIAHMQRLGGLPPKVLEEPRLLNLIVPMLRADITAIDAYRYQPHEQYPVPILALFGSQETALPAMIMDWQVETSSTLTVKQVEGDHFFIFPQAQRLLELVKEESLRV